MVGIADEELIRRLTQRDGPLPERTMPHAIDDECRFAGRLRDRPCPWCEAEKRRRSLNQAE